MSVECKYKHLIVNFPDVQILYYLLHLMIDTIAVYDKNIYIHYNHDVYK